MAQLVRLFTVVLAFTVAACGGGSPNAPTPVDNPPPGASCPTGNTLAVEVKYVRQAEKVNPKSIDIPGIAYRPFDQGEAKTVPHTLITKLDFLTWTTTLSFPENGRGRSHVINAGDGALLPNSAMTATDIFVNGVLVAKGPSPSGAGEYGWFRIDGCGKVTGIR